MCLVNKGLIKGPLWSKSIHSFLVGEEILLDTGFGALFSKPTIQINPFDQNVASTYLIILLLGDLDDVIAVLGLHYTTDLTCIERKGGFLEVWIHLTFAKEP